MKTLNLTCALALALVIALVVPAYSAVMGSPTMTAKVPFAFTAGKTQLPSGTYRLEPAHLQGVFTLANEEGRRIMLMTSPGVNVSTSSKGLLTFQQNGDAYVLSAIQLPGADHSREMPAPAGKPVIVSFSR